LTIYNLPVWAGNKTLPACVGQAGKQEFKMKKRIGLVVKIGLAALLLAATAGTVFAKPGDSVAFRGVGGMLDLSGRENLNDNSPGERILYGDDTKNVTVHNKKYAKIKILGVKQSLLGIDVTYSCDNAPGKVVFYFTAYFTAGRNPVSWENQENITSSRKSSTFKFTLANYLYLDYVTITWYPMNRPASWKY
jgi:hypothetical protein